MLSCISCDQCKENTVRGGFSGCGMIGSGETPRKPIPREAKPETARGPSELLFSHLDSIFKLDSGYVQFPPVCLCFTPSACNSVEIPSIMQQLRPFIFAIREKKRQWRPMSNSGHVSPLYKRGQRRQASPQDQTEEESLGLSDSLWFLS